MTRNDLVSEVAAKSGLSKTDATKAIDAVTEAIASALKSDDQVRLPAFGTFFVIDRPARAGRNPRTGDAVHIPSSKSARFRPSKGLKDVLRDT